MAMNWVEPTIKNKVFELCIECEKDSEVDRLTKRFIELLNLLKLQNIDPVNGGLMEIEEILYSISKLNIESSYRTGLHDGVNLGSELKFLLDIERSLHNLI